MVHEVMKLARTKSRFATNVTFTAFGETATNAELMAWRQQIVAMGKRLKACARQWLALSICA